MVKLQQIVLFNRAPFQSLELDVRGDGISIFSGINGRGKTTIVSYIADSFFELAKKAFHNEFRKNPTMYYRLSSDLEVIDKTKPSIVYLRFEHNQKMLDYIDIRGRCQESEYDKTVKLSNKIGFSFIKNSLENQNCAKHWSVSDEKEIKGLFNTSLMTYFPSYRYEIPLYLNDPYKEKISFDLSTRYDGFLPNPIENISGIKEISNWIMDVVLDWEFDNNNQRTKKIIDYLVEVVGSVLEKKNGSNISISIGQRFTGKARLSISQDGKVIYPSIFGMSSGELAMVALFGELIKQTDVIGQSIDSISGIVLVDELEKHLHMSLQRKILPKLLLLFPNIQFIVTTHSPFLTVGLAEKGVKHRIYDLDNGGLCSSSFEVVTQYLEMMNTVIDDNNNFTKKYGELLKTVNNGRKPIVVTEGKTDRIHLLSALQHLNISDIDVEFVECEGDTDVIRFINNYVKTVNHRLIIGMFDRDNIKQIVKSLPEASDIGVKPFVKIDNKAYVFSIPTVNESEYGSEISIEHYYHRCDLLKESKDGRRLFLRDEFYNSGNSLDGKYQTNHRRTNEGSWKIIDCDVFSYNDIEHKKSVALSKNEFAVLMNDNEFSKNVDFSAFTVLFNIIRDIITDNEEHEDA